MKRPYYKNCLKDIIYKELDNVEKEIEKGGGFRYLEAYKDGIEFVLDSLKENTSGVRIKNKPKGE